MKKSEVMDRVQELLSDKGGEMRTLVSHWIDMTLNDMASRGLLKSLKREESTSLVQGQRHYNLKADTDHVFKVFVPAWGETAGVLHKKNEEEFLALMFQDGFAEQAQPYAYNIFAQYTLRVHPIPDAASAPAAPTTLQKLYIWKYRDVIQLADNDDITEIKIKHIPLLIQGAYAIGAKFDSAVDARDAEAKYERGVRRMIGDTNLDLDRASQVKYRDVG